VCNDSFCRFFAFRSWSPYTHHHPRPVQNSEFKAVGEKIMGRLNDMEGRFEELEHSVVLLLDQAGLNNDDDGSSAATRTTTIGGSPQNGTIRTTTRGDVVPSRVVGGTASSSSPPPPSPAIINKSLLSPLRKSPKSVGSGGRFTGSKVSVAI
jgi:hypothetical protein